MNFEDNISADFSARDADAGVDPRLVTRWSPRAFKKVSLAAQDITTLFDAARWAPSCQNAQPWRFYVSTEDSFDQYLSLLVEGNQIWAKNASVLCFVVVKKTFEHNGKPNGFAEFDAGAAWMALAIQARAMGLYTHAMGGIKAADITQALALDDDHKVVCGIAIGVAADASTLPAELAAREKPTPRKALADIVFM